MLVCVNYFPAPFSPTAKSWSSAEQKHTKQLIQKRLHCVRFVLADCLSVLNLIGSSFFFLTKELGRWLMTMPVGLHNLGFTLVPC